MRRWCGTDWGGEQPDEERPEALASFGGDVLIEVELRVAEEPEDDAWEP